MDRVCLLLRPSAEYEHLLEMSYDTFFHQLTELKYVLHKILFRQREEQIEQSLLPQVLGICEKFVVISASGYSIIQNWVLEDASTYYSEKASQLLMVNSYKDYMLKVNEFKEYEEHVDYCSPFNIWNKEILQIVNENMLVAPANMLEVLKKIENGEDNGKDLLTRLVQNHRRHQNPEMDLQMPNPSKRLHRLSTYTMGLSDPLVQICTVG